jgi:hypothetical protein
MTVPWPYYEYLRRVSDEAYQTENQVDYEATQQGARMWHRELLRGNTLLSVYASMTQQQRHRRRAQQSLGHSPPSSLISMIVQNPTHGFPLGYFVIRSVATNRLLDVNHDDMRDGAHLILWPEKESSLVQGLLQSICLRLP